MMEVIKTNGSKIGTALMVVPKGALRWKRRIFGFGKMMKYFDSPIGSNFQKGT